MNVNLKNLLSRLNATSKMALEGASGLCVSSSHYEVDVAHLLLQLIDDSSSDVAVILKNNQINLIGWKKRLQFELDILRKGNPGRPVFSNRIIECIENAWMHASLVLGLNEIRTSSILAVMAARPMMYGVEELDGIQNITADNINHEFKNITLLSGEDASSVNSMNQGKTNPDRINVDSCLSRFTTNFTQRARQGDIDPVFGRDKEIRQIVDILARRRKNNPIAVGDAGVGKTAVIEGLALKISEGDVPDVIKDADILALDLGLLQAGASVKGEFENRLNSVIHEIKSSVKPIILFIDEAHTLIGAGGSAGTNDAANILKPALARGELKTIAATTWSEYKKYFEKDTALERRFQLVKLDEPSVEETAVILRGLRPVYEHSHNVYILDEAITAAAILSARFITGRQLPDKAVDVLDTACARVKISLTTMPSHVEDLQRKVSILGRELEALKRDVHTGRSSNIQRLEQLQCEIDSSSEALVIASEEWKTELAVVNKLIDARKHDPLVDASNVENREITTSEPSSDIREIDRLQAGVGKIAYEVTAAVVEKVISDLTGIPVTRLVQDDINTIFKLRDEMKLWVRGQDHAVDIIDSTLRAAKAGINNPDQPLGVFLLVGPSGVGKTETALGVANLMFGGERFMTTINMSEYQEKHTVSRLVGSPAGYVGYGEGGVLTEAIRQRPYSVLLLDEVEKADLEVMNLFHQVFDKGTLSDGEGRIIDFKNTVIFLTSNIASSTIMNLCADEHKPDFDKLIEAVRPQLQNHFKPALLGRMTIIPYYPIRSTVLNEIIRSKLEKLSSRIFASQKLALAYDDEVISMISRHCTDAESGARNVDHVMNKKLIPMISDEILQRTGAEGSAKTVRVRVEDNQRFVVSVI